MFLEFLDETQQVCHFSSFFNEYYTVLQFVRQKWTDEIDLWKTKTPRRRVLAKARLGMDYGMSSAWPACVCRLI
jgi:hypothetical protein